MTITLKVDVRIIYKSNLITYMYWIFEFQGWYHQAQNKMHELLNMSCISNNYSRGSDELCSYARSLINLTIFLSSKRFMR